MKTETSERIVYDANGVVVARDRFNWIVYDRQTVKKGDNQGEQYLANATYHGNIAQAAIEAGTRTKDAKESDSLQSIAKAVIQGQREIFSALRGDT